MGFPMKDSFTNVAPPTASNSNDDNNKNNNDENDVVSLEETYTALIQEYLQVMCLDNATFLAERLVASCPSSSNALYMLAICHYRAGAPKRALMVLDDICEAMPSADFLKAKCCYDLEYYGRAEDALLHEARSEFKQLLLSGHDSTTTKSMNDWILETTPCPVPNGAVGLNLLGNICRRSSRKERAIKYFRMSLQVSCYFFFPFEDTHLLLRTFLIFGLIHLIFPLHATLIVGSVDVDKL